MMVQLQSAGAGLPFACKGRIWIILDRLVNSKLNFFWLGETSGLPASKSLTLKLTSRCGTLST
jgi:hypothetical protein